MFLVVSDQDAFRANWDLASLLETHHVQFFMVHRAKFFPVKLFFAELIVLRLETRMFSFPPAIFLEILTVVSILFTSFKTSEYTNIE